MLNMPKSASEQESSQSLGDHWGTCFYHGTVFVPCSSHCGATTEQQRMLHLTAVMSARVAVQHRVSELRHRSALRVAT